eukprot:7143394-Pyramimonas_sp.AAC.2
MQAAYGKEPKLKKSLNSSVMGNIRVDNTISLGNIRVRVVWLKAQRRMILHSGGFKFSFNDAYSTFQENGFGNQNAWQKFFKQQGSEYIRSF